MSLFPQPGPTLPSFKTLLIKGDYHASAPVHLALSSLARSGPDAEAILITPTRQAITQTLRAYNDAWLTVNSGCGDIAALSTRIKVYYPPSPAHLCLLLSMFRVSRPTDVESGAWINSKTTLAVSPSIIILHEPSSYILSEETGDADPSQWTASSYLEMVINALSSSTFLSLNGVSAHPGPCFALFDSRLDRMKLPILKQQHYEEDSPPRLELLSPLVQKYFEWMVVADPERDLIDEGKRRKGMNVYRMDQYPEIAETWEWWETPDPASLDERPGKAFVWGS